MIMDCDYFTHLFDVQGSMFRNAGLGENHRCEFDDCNQVRPLLASLLNEFQGCSDICSCLLELSFNKAFYLAPRRSARGDCSKPSSDLLTPIAAWGCFPSGLSLRKWLRALDQRIKGPSVYLAYQETGAPCANNSPSITAS